MKKKYKQEDSSVQGSVFLRLLKYAAPYWWQMAICLLLVLGITVLEIIRPKLMGEAIDLFAQSADFSQIAQITAKYAIVLVLLFTFNFLNTWILQLTGQTIIYNIRQELFADFRSMFRRHGFVGILGVPDADFKRSGALVG